MTYRFQSGLLQGSRYHRFIKAFVYAGGYQHAQTKHSTMLSIQVIADRNSFQFFQELQLRQTMIGKHQQQSCEDDEDKSHLSHGFGVEFLG